MQHYRYGPRDVLVAALVSVWLVALPQGSSENCDMLVSGGFEDSMWLTQLNFNTKRNQDMVPASDCLRYGMKKMSSVPLPSVLTTLNQHRRMLGLGSLSSSPRHLRGGCMSGIGDDEPSSVQVEESLDEDQVGALYKQIKERCFNDSAHHGSLSHFHFDLLALTDWAGT
jgi:hypothetical protein